MRQALVSLVALVIGLSTACSDSPVNGDPPSITPLLRSTVLVTKNGGHGSGAIIGPNLVLTAYHAIRGKGKPDISFLGGASTTGKVIWSEPDRDLALVKVDIPDGYPAAALHCKEHVPGQHVTTVGHPFRSRWVALSGHLPKKDQYHRRYISLGFRISRGVSGGPVFNNEGQVIGITLGLLARRLHDQSGVGFMLPASAFCQKIKQEQMSLAETPPSVNAPH